MMIKRQISLFLVICLMLVFVPSYAAADNLSEHWAERELTDFIDRGILKGDQLGNYAPDNLITRAEFIALVNRVAQFTESSDKIAAFTDVDQTDWYYQDMAKALYVGYIKGTSATTLSPEAPITREQAFTILGRLINLRNDNSQNVAQFNDRAMISSYALQFINALVKQNFVQGYNGMLHPQRPLSRAEAVVLLSRLQSNIESAVVTGDKTEKTDEVVDATTVVINTSNGGGNTSGGNSNGGGSNGNTDDNSGNDGNTDDDSDNDGNIDDNGGNDGNTDNNGDDTEETVSYDIVNEAQTKLVDLGFAEFVVVSFSDGYNSENCSVIIDGVDISDALTPVVDDKTIAKWEITSLKPAKLVAQSKTNSAAQEEVKLSDNNNPTAPVVRAGRTLPYQIMAHGPVAVWDYHLSNYDAAGNLRVSPIKTTIALQENINAHKYYCPDVILVEDDSNQYEVSGEVTIMFNYESAEDKAFFDSIAETGALALLEYDERHQVLNDHLVYSKQVMPHGTHTVGVLKIAIPQTNFYTNKRYHIRVTGDDVVLVKLNVVNEKQPSLLLNETGSLKSGKNIHFTVKDMPYAITVPIEFVSLQDPQGNVVELREINDWALIGDLFVLYNDEASEDGRNNIPLLGKYKLHIEAVGFKAFDKEFIVNEAAPTAPAAPAQPIAPAAAAPVVHALSAASGGGNLGGGSGSGSGGGGSMMSANLVFNADLLANAKILVALGIENNAAKSIAERWDYDIAGADYAYQEGGPFYTWQGYFNAHQDAVVNGNYLPFVDYIELPNAEIALNKPYAVKEILADGLLGATQYGSSFKDKTPPQLYLLDHRTSIMENEDAVLVSDLAGYLGRITSIRINNQYPALSADDYTIDGNQLTISKDKLRLGDNSVVITATGYKDNSLNIKCDKVLEDVSLSLASNQYKQLDEVVINVSSADFTQNIKGVKLDDAELFEKIAFGESSDWYFVDKDEKQVHIKGALFSEIKVYSITLSAEYYPDETITVDILEGDVEEPEVTTPEVESTKKTADGLEVTFDDTNGVTTDEIISYIDSILSAQVNEKIYSKKPDDSNLSDNQYERGIGDYGTVLRLKWTTGFKDTEDSTVTLTAGDSYDVVTFKVDKEGHLVTDDTQPKVLPTLKKAEKQSDTFGNYHFVEVSFELDDTVAAEREALAAYLNSITEINGVKVGDAFYSKNQNNFGTVDNSFKLDGGLLAGEPAELKLRWQTGFSAMGNTTVVVMADGYDNLTFKVDKDGNLTTGDDQTDAVPPAVDQKTKKFDDANGLYVEVTFDAAADITTTYLNALDGVKVGEKQYQAGDLAANKYKVAGNTLLLKWESGFKSAEETAIVLTADGYTELTFEVPANEPAPTRNTVTKENDDANGDYVKVTFTGEATGYLSALNTVKVGAKIYNSIAEDVNLSDNKYKVVDGNTLLLKWGEGFKDNDPTTVALKATGYQDANFTFEEQKLTPPAVDQMSKVDSWSGSHAEITFTGSFQDYLNKISLVVFNVADDEGNPTTEYQIDENYNLEKDEFKIGVDGYTIPKSLLLKWKSAFEKEANPTITIKATGYKDQTFDFKLQAPTTEAMSHQYSSSLGDYVKITFSGNNAQRFLEGLKGNPSADCYVKVGGTADENQYSFSSGYSAIPDNNYRISTSDKCINLAWKDKFNDSGETEIFLKSPGYDELKLKFIPTAPEIDSVVKEESFYYGDSVKVTFTGDYQPFLAKLTNGSVSVTAGGNTEEYNKHTGSNLPANTFKVDSDYSGNSYLKINWENGFSNDADSTSTVTISADGYDDLTFVVNKDGNLVP